RPVAGHPRGAADPVHDRRAADLAARPVHRRRVPARHGAGGFDRGPQTISGAGSAGERALPQGPRRYVRRPPDRRVRPAPDAGCGGGGGVSGTRIKAILPYFGGKRTLAPRIVAELGEHSAYWGLCCGSLAVELAKSP